MDDFLSFFLIKKLLNSSQSLSFYTVLKIDKNDMHFFTLPQ